MHKRIAAFLLAVLMTASSIMPIIASAEEPTDPATNISEPAQDAPV